MRASSDACVAMWLVVGVSALLPFGAEAQCTELTCDVAVDASIDSTSEVDCFAFTATDVFLRRNGLYIDVGGEEGRAFIEGSMSRQSFRFSQILEWIREHIKPVG